jgi:hypothetical protein
MRRNIMKTFTYVAAIALLAAGTAFAQSGNNNSTINNSTPTPSATGPADSAGTMSNQSGKPIAGPKQSGSMNQSGSMGMDKSSGSMDQSMGQSSGKAPKSASKMKSHHVARSGGNDSKENQETLQLNRQQVAGGNASMLPSGSSGMSSSGAGNAFNNGSPQQAQGGGANCTPDNPSCGTARQNPAINSSPQHRTYGDQQ